MKNKRVILSVGIGLGAGLLAFFVLRRRGMEHYLAPKPGNLVIELAPYNGKYKDDPNIKKFQRRFPSIAKQAVARIKSMNKLTEPSIHILVELDDSFEADPFILPSASTGCKRVPYTKEGGNCSQYGFKLGSKNIIDKYKGRTSADKIVIHELTHNFMLFHIPGHDKMPDYIIEGVPIHTAGQQDEIRAVQNDPKLNNGNGKHNYKPGEIHVNNYGELIDRYQEVFGG